MEKETKQRLIEIGIMSLITALILLKIITDKNNEINNSASILDPSQAMQGMTKYYSQDSLFSIGVPDDYSLSPTTLPTFISFTNDDDAGSIFIIQNSKMNKAAFEDYVNQQTANITVESSNKLVEKNDSIFHYKFMKGMFVIHSFYMLKRGKVNDYLINANSMSLNKKTALGILSSITEYELKEYTFEREERNNYNYYTDAGFAINKSYDLQQNKSYIKAYNDLAQKNKKLPILIASFTCAQNTEQNEHEIVKIINLNVNELNSQMNGDAIISGYKQSLKANGFKYHDVKHGKLIGVEYYFEQDFAGTLIPTKAIYGYKGDKLFLIQLATLSDLQSKFDEFKKSIIIL